MTEQICPRCLSTFELRTLDGDRFCLRCNWERLMHDRCYSTLSNGVMCGRNAETQIGGVSVCWLHYELAEKYVLARIKDAREIAAESTFESDVKCINDRPRKGFVYYAERDGFVKIGKAINVASRLRDISLGGIIMPPGVVPGPVTLLAQHAGGLIAERAMHAQFHSDRIAGEWFRLSPALQTHIEKINARRAA